MNKLAVPAFCICMLAAPAWAQSEDVAVTAQAAVDALETAAEPVPEQIHVVAQRPGPGMWKVSKGEHVLWVFGMYGPVPQDMQWRSQQVENVIRNSQEYLSPPTASANPGFFKSITLLPSMIGMRKNPDGATLRDVMPAEDYARWTALKAKYLPENDDVERERPIFAAEVLSNAARKQAGLVDSYTVRKPLLDLVKKAKLKETASTFQLPMDNARTVLKNFKKSTLGDAACLTRTMATLEQDLEAASRRANAWAKGDVDEMRKLDFATREEACFGALMNSAAFDAEPEFKNMKARADAMWIASAEKALAANASTFAVLKIESIFDPKGVIAALAAKGYTVEQPD
ncbi:TraB/GumN family protein [Massilia arenae]|uniref:TraB/GumN family protein n=1 Tax=Massilia arenae TaxID=2603288 RepID=A0A5C7G2Q3_9BURK|nr:TraB/GumN family protein [Massilia arenae]TXF98714.1 TraB/GumN family protein [Massilia arenae]